MILRDFDDLEYAETVLGKPLPVRCKDGAVGSVQTVWRGTMAVGVQIPGEPELREVPIENLDLLAWVVQEL